jgi:hypothetical protein
VTAFGNDSPSRDHCRKCPEAYVGRCPGCERPYLAPDFNTDYHGCGEKIPWADARDGILQVAPIYTGPTSSPSPTRELTAAERQDLLVPPSERPPVQPIVERLRDDRDVFGRRVGTRDEPSNIGQYVGGVDHAVEKTGRRVLRSLMTFFGRSFGKGVEESIVFIVKWGLLAIIVAVAGYCGLRLAFGP